MPLIEYVGEILSDGNLSLPESIRSQLDRSMQKRVRVILSPYPVDDAMLHAIEEFIRGHIATAEIESNPDFLDSIGRAKQDLREGNVAGPFSSLVEIEGLLE